ncbi:AAC(3) family N-acetyltransferase [Vallitalea guaymasensis]|uniref:Aminoglycoside N(3)-acetyltransferase n=1 Tax=Vallitalea guaymasensis TaxID=1185412 RepID=A0A8J8M6Z1_9FIRM|nr:AAC(3) family N-acetyltransferase [Vallitalea guaymasensis]QUH27449.1 AAC(3) family N-acetyltransferase [Vallitalea guaymasensis]
MLIFGWGYKTIKKYGIIGKSKCNICKLVTNWQLVKVTTWFTLFFIPIIPVSVKRMIICTNCNGGHIVDKQTFDKLFNIIKSNKGNINLQEMQYYNKTETQKNYLKEMEEFRRSKDNKDKQNVDTKLTEKDIIDGTSTPNTRNSLRKQLEEMGLKKGMTVIIHSSMSNIGWISGGSVAVVQALMDVITDEGTIIMPAHTTDYSDPADWENPPVPKDWVSIIKENMPAFDKNITPTNKMGRIAETFRTYPGVLRSDHPHVSFTAWGKNAEDITKNHSLDYSLGCESPLKKIYDLDGMVLLLGVGYENNTSFHLAEYLISKKKEENMGAPILLEGKRKWVEYKDIELDVDDFDKIGSEYEEIKEVIKHKIGQAESRLFSQRQAVDFAKGWMEKNR